MQVGAIPSVWAKIYKDEKRNLFFIDGYMFLTIGNYNLPTTINKNPTKMGETCGHYAYPFSMLFSNNDLTVEKARRSANISEIISVEARNRYVYPFYYHRCIIVRGN